MAVTPNISDSDKTKIEELRSLVKDEISPYYDTDFNLLRWLKGHNYNLTEIVPKLRNHLTFRRSHWDLDHVVDKPRNHPIHKHWQSGLTGLAGKTKNALVNIEQSGGNDYWGLLHTYPINEIMRARVYDLEAMLRRVMEEEAKSGEQTSVVYFMDLTGLTYDKRLITLLTGALSSISAFMAEHYVELIHSFVLVNVPSFISVIWNIVRPLLPERTKNKVKILGSNWKTEVLELSDPESLPGFWNDDGESVFKADVLKAVPFPIEGYYAGGEFSTFDQLDVAAGKTAFVTVEAEEGQKLEWTFQTNGHFAYGLYYSDGVTEELSEMLVVYPRFNKVPGPTHVPLTDHIVCPKNGVYRLWFSNEHAWFHNLQIRYKVEKK